jgi:hypothetical protein
MTLIQEPLGACGLEEGCARVGMLILQNILGRSLAYAGPRGSFPPLRLLFAFQAFADEKFSLAV